MNKESLLYILFILIVYSKAHSQGCSDAGFCTMGALNQAGQNDSLKLNSAKLLLSFGIGEQGTTIIQTIPEVNFSLFRNNSIQVRMPYMFINGNLGSNKDIGDLSISITQLIKYDKYLLNLIVGTKIATNHSEKSLTPDYITFDNLPFPMPYQTSLGTNDLIFGASLEYKHWNFGVGYQHVISNNNKNGFLKYKWSANADAQKYFESNLLDRGDDALLRVEKIFLIKKFSLNAGLLALYRLQMDNISFQNIRKDVNGSDGLTLNLTASVQYSFSKTTGLDFSFGTPLVVREVRPDGLTRSVVLNASFNYHF